MRSKMFIRLRTETAIWHLLMFLIENYRWVSLQFYGGLSCQGYTVAENLNKFIGFALFYMIESWLIICEQYY
jgi:hypothetical protein